MHLARGWAGWCPGHICSTEAPWAHTWPQCIHETHPDKPAPATPCKQEVGSSASPRELGTGAPASVVPESLKAEREHSQQGLGQV